MTARQKSDTLKLVLGQSFPRIPWFAKCAFGTVVFIWLAVSIARAEEPFTISAGAHNEPIAYVLLQDGKKSVTQTASAKGRIRLTSGKLMLRELGLADGSVLRSFSFGNLVVLRDYARWGRRHRTGIGVVRPNGSIERLRRSSVNPFARALQASFNNTNLNNYWCDDGSDMWQEQRPAFDLQWSRASGQDAVIVVMERDGNSVFEMEALDDDGNPIAGARLLQLRPRYDWNTGFANARYISNQPYWLIAFSLAQFFKGAEAPPQLIHGIRVYNSGEADVKILVGRKSR